MTVHSEQCITCKWYQGLSSYEYGDISCTAFPKGIPIEILTGIHDHRFPFSGDKGITWEKESDDVLDALPTYRTPRERHTRQIAQYLEDLKEIENNPACPECGTNLHQIIYGMPAGPPTFGYAIGGCVIIDSDFPRFNWWCRKCNIATNEDEITLSDLAREFSCLEKVDRSPFQRSARILQSMWRDKKGYEIGEFKTRNGSRLLGSRLPMPSARETLSNYLTQNIRDVVKSEVLDRTKSQGKLYSKPRIFNDLLSSQPLCFNLFGELKKDLSLATRVIKLLVPGVVGEVTDIDFEWSPGQGDPKLTGDRSAFDVYVSFRPEKGGKGFIGIEVKYHENLIGKSAATTDRHREIAGQMKCFYEDSLEYLEKQPLQQIWRDHMLAGIHKIVNEFEEGFFVFLYPDGNTHCSDAVAKYQECLTNQQTFTTWTLESVASAIKSETTDEWIDLFVDRYLDFAKIPSVPTIID